MNRQLIISLYSFFVLLCEIIIIYYLYHLEKIGCKCSLNYRRNYILIYNVCIVCVSVFMLFTHINPSIIFPIFGVLFLFASILNVIFTIQYVNELKKQKCDCSESFMRNLMYILAIIQIFSWVLVIVTLIIVAITYGYFYKHTNQLKNFKIKNFKIKK